MSFGFRIGAVFVSRNSNVHFEAEDYSHEYLDGPGLQECSLIFRKSDNNDKVVVTGLGSLRAEAIQDAFKNAMIELHLDYIGEK